MGSYFPKNGDILFGPFASDFSPHNAVILNVIDKKVYLFPISSQEQTMNYYKSTDGAAVVELSDEDKRAIFRDKAKPISFIYCGKRNIISRTVAEIQMLVASGKAYVQRANASEALIESIVWGVYYSRTNDEETIKSILGSRNPN